MITAEQYLRAVLAGHHIDTGAFSPVRSIQSTIVPVLRQWGGQHVVDIRPSGSFAKGTAVRGGTDIDIFVSLSSNLQATLKSIYDSLFQTLAKAGYHPRRQNVSVGIAVQGFSVDVTPARRQDVIGQYHSLFSNRTGNWLQTNIDKHIQLVTQAGRADEIRLIKIWRNLFGIDWPSFYLELFVIEALSGAHSTNLTANVTTTLTAVQNSITTFRIMDPGNTNNVVSDTLTAGGRTALSLAARAALKSPWTTVFR